MILPFVQSIPINLHAIGALEVGLHGDCEPSFWAKKGDAINPRFLRKKGIKHGRKFLDGNKTYLSFSREIKLNLFYSCIEQLAEQLQHRSI